MSVLPFGAPDYADTGPWDNGVFDWLDSGTFNATITSPALECSHYGIAYMYGILTAGAARFDATWYTDSTLTTSVGLREVILDAGMPSAAQLLVVNLGPWLQMSATLLPGVASITGTLAALLNNRQPAPAHSQVSGILGNFTPNLAAGGAQTFYSAHYHGGPVMVLTNGGSQGVQVAFNFRGTNDGLWHPFARYTVAANTDDMRQLLFPQHAVQWVITNSSGVNPNTTSTIVATAAIAGSS